MEIGEAGSSAAREQTRRRGGMRLQVLGFLPRLEETQPQPEFSRVGARLFVPPEARHSAGMSALHKEAPESSQCPYKGLGRGEAAERPVRQPYRRQEFRALLGKQPKRETPVQDFKTWHLRAWE